MRIGKASREAGVNVQTLRYYERRGLLPKTSRLASGYREYDSATVGLVRFIRSAQALGFTLSEIGELIALRGNRSQSDEDVRRLATQKIDCVIIDAFDHASGHCRAAETTSINGEHPC